MATAKLTSKSKNDEKKLISNEYHECKFVADKFAIPVWRVYQLKHILGTNDRAKIYEAIGNMAEAVTPQREPQAPPRVPGMPREVG